MPPNPGYFGTGVGQTVLIVRTDINAKITLDGLRNRFTAKAEDELLKNDTVDDGGRVTARRIPGGYSGTLVCERQNANFSAFVAFMDSLYYSGLDDVYCAITVTTPSADSSTPETVQYTRVVFHNYSPGDFERRTIPKPTVEFFATERIQL